jgi:hypothetical protein
MATLNPASPKVLRALSRRIFFISHHVSAFYAVTFVTAALLLALMMGAGLLWAEQQALIEKAQSQITFTLPPALSDQKDAIASLLRADPHIKTVDIAPLSSVFTDEPSLSQTQTPLFVVTLRDQKHSDVETAWKDWHDAWPFLIRLNPDTQRQGENIKERLRLNLVVFSLSLVLLSGAQFLLARSIRVTLGAVAESLMLFDARGTVWHRLWGMLPRVPMILCFAVVALLAVIFSWAVMGPAVIYRLPLLLLGWAVVTAAVCLIPWRLAR